MGSAKSATVIDNDQVRVTTWTFTAAGDGTGPHVHEYDYVVVPVTGGTFTVTDSDGTTHDLIQHAGTPYLGSSGTAHNVVGAAATFVEIELKR